MNRVAPPRRPGARSAAVEAPAEHGERHGRRGRLCTAGRGRSVGSSSGRERRRAARASRRAARSQHRRPRASARCQSGEVGVLDAAAPAAARLARGEGRVERRQLADAARPSTSRRRRCGAWSTSSTCSSLAQAQQAARRSGPRARSNGAPASSAARRARLRLRAAAGRPARSIDAAAARRPAAATTCTGSPSDLGEGGAQRLVAARRSRPAPPRRRRPSSAPREAHGDRHVVAALPGSSRSRNQSRCWAKESGSGAVRAARHDRRRRRRRSPPRRSRSRRPGRPRSASSKSARSGSSTPRASRARARSRGWRGASGRRGRRSRRATPTRSTPSTSPQIAGEPLLRSACAAPRSRRPRRRPAAGAGRARRSTLPLGVSGSASRATKAGGHHVLRQPRPGAARSSAGVGLGPSRRHHVGDQPLVARPVLARPQHGGLAHRRGGRERRLDLARLDAEAADLTCWSARPRNSSVPSGRQRARSPVR